MGIIAHFDQNFKDSKMSTLINEDDAAIHETNLQEITAAFLACAKERDNSPDLYDKYITEIREACVPFTGEIRNAVIDVVVKSIVDVRCTILRDPDLSPSAIPFVKEATVPTQAEFQKELGSNISQEQYEQIESCFETLAEAHDKASTACTKLATLSRVLPPSQFMTLCRLACAPSVNLQVPKELIELSTPSTVEEEESSGKYEYRVMREILPRYKHPVIKNEPEFNSTRLLAATVYFLVRRQLLETGKQKTIANLFKVKEKTLARAINGKKYSGGKPKDTDNDPEPSTSKEKEEEVIGEIIVDQPVQKELKDEEEEEEVEERVTRSRTFQTKPIVKHTRKIKKDKDDEEEETAKPKRRRTVNP